MRALELILSQEARLGNGAPSSLDKLIVTIHNGMKKH